MNGAVVVAAMGLGVLRVVGCGYGLGVRMVLNMAMGRAGQAVGSRQPELSFDENGSSTGTEILGTVGPGAQARPQVVGRLLLTPVEAASMLGIGRTKLYELMARGQVESVRIDSCRRFPIQAVHAYIDRLRTQNWGDHDGRTQG